MTSHQNLLLAHPTPAERTQIYTATFSSWGTAFTLPAYLEREDYLTTVPLARNGGLEQWILTTEDEDRPVLSSCETLRKRAIVRLPGADSLEDVHGYGIASVFTYTEMRGHGNAQKMLARLAETLARENDGFFSVLFSDIGKTFYAKIGWRAHESAHFAFPADTTPGASDARLKTITEEDLPALAARDEQLLRQRLLRPGDESKTRIALLPDLDTLLWHARREDFMCRAIFNTTATARGVLYQTDAGRVWAIFMRGFYGGLAKPEKNTLHLLRFVVEDEDMPDEALAAALEDIISASKRDAAEWKCHRVEMWNPDVRVRRLAAGLGGEYVVREAEEICAMNLLGKGEEEQVDWVASEKFAWC